MDSETFGVRTSWSLPIAPPGTSWDGAGAPARIAKWAGGPGDGTNWAKYAQAFLWAGKTGPGASQGDFKLPIADVINGKLMIVPKAIAAVKGALSGARGGVDIPPADKSTIAGVIGRLSKRWDPDGDGDDDRSPATDSDKDQGKKGGASIHPDAMAVKVPKGIKGAPGPMKEVPDADGTASIHKGAEGKHHPGPMSIHKDAEGKHHPGPMSKKDDKGDKVEPEVEPDEPDDDEDDDEDENQPQPPEEKPGQGKATKKDLKKAQKTAKKAQKSAGGVAGEPDSDTYSLVAGGPLAPPLEWFANPKLERLTNLAVTAEGRVYGHLAPWGQAHISFSDAQMVAPHSATEYAYFLTGEVLCNDGTTVPVGRITIGTGHADPNFGFRPALAHYDNTGTCAAVVNVGEDEYGIWVAGVTVPNLTDEQTAELRRSPLSGDWRRIHGNLELIGALAVNHPGFPVARVEGSRQLSLVAAGMAVPDLAGTPMTVGIGPDLTVDDIVELAVREASIRGERQAQLATLMAVDAMRRAQALAELPASIGE